MEILKKNRSLIIIITYTVALVAVFFNLEQVNSYVSNFLGLMSPIIYGLVFAFLVGLIARGVRFAYYKLFGRGKYVDNISIVIGYIIFLAIIAGFFLMVIPALDRSIRQITSSLPEYLTILQDFMRNIGQRLELGPEQWEMINGYLNQIYATSYSFLTGKLPDLLSYAFNMFNFIKDLGFGFVISIYILMSRKSLQVQAKKTITVLLSEQYAKKVIKTAKKAKYIFSKYISGQVIVSVVLGVACYVSMLIFRMPFAELVSLIIGVSNLVPIVGPIVGSIPTTIIVMMESPIKGLWFLVLVIVLQQLENNILSPKIIGDSVGMSGLWVMIAIILGGAFFGVGGMIIAVPTMGVIYHLFRNYINSRYNSEKFDEFIKD